MDTYRKPPRVNRYWKRPKPRVYDCNVRDAERFYQESYKTYQMEKEEAAARAARARSIETSLQTEFYPHLVAGSIRRDAPNRSPIDMRPLPPSLSDTTRARVEAELSPSLGTSTETSFTARVSTRTTPDPGGDAASLEERISRLKKLREEMGLPAESPATQVLRSESVGRNAASASISSDLDSYRTERTARRPVEAASEETSSLSLRSERLGRLNGSTGSADDLKLRSEATTNGYSRFRSERSSTDDRYKTDLGTSDYKLKSDSGTSDYKYKSDSRTSDYKLKSDSGAGDYKYKSDLGTSDYKYKSDMKSDDFKVGSGRSLDLDFRSERKPRNLSPKAERKRDEFSYSASTDKSSERFSSVGSSAATKRAAAKEEVGEVDDDSLASVMKKMPSSQEILERISKMELDD